MHLKASDIRIMQAGIALDETALGKQIDRSFQRSVSSWAAWRRKRAAQKAATASKAEALRQSLAA